MLTSDCDRAFTRSDALTKHTRTVHEGEPMRPPDLVTRTSGTPAAKPQRLKLVLTSKSRLEEANDSPTRPAPCVDTSHVVFSEAEQRLAPRDLSRLVKRQLRWTEDEHDALQKEVVALEQQRRNEWLAKEFVLANLMEADLALSHLRGESEENVKRVLADLPQTPLPMQRQEAVWYRQVADENMQA